jgi:hypothetical protein
MGRSQALPVFQTDLQKVLTAARVCADGISERFLQGLPVPA